MVSKTIQNQFDALDNYGARYRVAGPGVELDPCRTPMLDAARALLASGIDPSTGLRDIVPGRSLRCSLARSGLRPVRQNDYSFSQHRTFSWFAITRVRAS